jgi:hypothetical protein
MVCDNDCAFLFVAAAYQHDYSLSSEGFCLGVNSRCFGECMMGSVTAQASSAPALLTW